MPYHVEPCTRPYTRTYEVQLLQALVPNEKPKRKEFAVNILVEFLKIKLSSNEFVLETR